MIDCSGLRLALFSDTFPPQINGVARTLERLDSAVIERGGEVRVYTVSDDQAEETPHVVRFSSRAFPAYQELRLAWPRHEALLADLRRFNPTLVHSATEFGVGIAGLRSARALGVPFVSSYHTNFTQYASYYRLGIFASPGWRFLRWFHNAGLRTYVPTNAIAEQVRDRGFRNVKIWSRGVDTERFNRSYRSQELRQRIGAGDNELVVAYIGRLAPEKGIEVALNAMRIVEKQRPGATRFICVGDGPFSEEVKQLAPAGSWLPGKLTGDALSTAYASSDLFIFPSVTDTFGNVQLEAMASGLAVLGADVPATREIIGSGRGFLAVPGSSESFASCIVRLVDNRGLLEKARQLSLEYAAACRWEDIWDTLIADYLSVHSGTRVLTGIDPADGIQHRI